jgi:hypothetical protein
MRLILLGLFAVLLAPAQQPAAGSHALDPAYESDIRKLLELNGSRALLQSHLDQMPAMMQQFMQTSESTKNLPPEFHKEFIKRFRERLKIDECMTTAVQIYAKHFTRDEVAAILAFESTPAGRKFRSETAALQKDFMLSFQQLGASLGYDIGVEISKEHPEYDTKPTITPAGKP